MLEILGELLQILSSLKYYSLAMVLAENSKIMKEPHYIYHVTAWSTDINSPYSEYVIERESTIQAYLNSFDKDIFDDGIQAVVETNGFQSFQDAENYLLEYYQK